MKLLPQESDVKSLYDGHVRLIMNAEKVRKLREQGASISDLSRRFNVTRRTVANFIGPPKTALRVKKWSAAEKYAVLKLREERGLGPLAISKITGIPIGQIRFWLYPYHWKKTAERLKKLGHETRSRKSKKAGSLRAYYRLKFENWEQYKSQTLASAFRSKYKKEIAEGLCKPLSVADIREWLVENFENPCHYCGCKLTHKNFGADHAQPVARGGANAIENLRACCRGCNTAKGVLTEREFQQLLKLVSKWEDGGKSLLARLKRGFLRRWGK